MRTYFQVQEYYGNMKARVAIFNLTERESIWWEHFGQVKNINERNIVWKQFSKYFKQKYLSDIYYDDKIKEFHAEIGTIDHGRICKQILGTVDVCQVYLI